MRTALMMEIRKVRSLRLWWLLLVSMVVVLAVAAAGMTLLGTTPAARETGALVVTEVSNVVLLYNLTPALAFILPMLLGALSLTTEYRHQTVTSTFLAHPARWTVVAAKAVVSVGLGLVFGMVGVVTCVVSTAVVLMVTGHATMLGDPMILPDLARGVLAMGLWGLLGLGVGSLVRNQVVAVVGLIVATQFIEPILRVMLTAVSGSAAVAKLLPAAASDALAGDTVFAAASSLPLLEPFHGGLVLGLYALVLVGVGAFLTMRRSIN